MSFLEPSSSFGVWCDVVVSTRRIVSPTQWHMGWTLRSEVVRSVWPHASNTFFFDTHFVFIAGLSDEFVMRLGASSQSQFDAAPSCDAPWFYRDQIITKVYVRAVWGYILWAMSSDNLNPQEGTACHVHGYQNSTCCFVITISKTTSQFKRRSAFH